MKAFYNETEGKTEIARIFTIGCNNNRDIIRRLMDTCESFKRMTLADAAATFRAYDRDGLVKRVEKGLFDVTVTIPADFLDDGITQEQLDAQAKANGYKSITLNEDGSATYVMTKAQHKEMMDGIKQSIDESLSDMAGSADYPDVVSIDANDDYTKYKIVLNKDELGLQESFLVMGLYVFSGMYHIFNGTEVGNVNIQYVNEATGSVIQEVNSDNIG